MLPTHSPTAQRPAPISPIAAAPNRRSFLFRIVETACLCLVIIATAPARAAEPADAPPPPLRVMTWNIRFDNPGDGPDAWPRRREAVAQLFKDETVDVAGLQEALKSQIDDLAERLPNFGWYGVGRDDGREGGEFGPIFYRRDRLVVEDQGQFWLSEHPDEPGRKDWGAACARMATWIAFRDRQTDQRLVFYNTHFDHVSGEARQKGAQLIRTHVAQNPVPLRIVMGDLNALPDAEPVQLLVAPPEEGAEPVLRAAHDIAESRSGPDSTWTGFRRVSPGRRIDHVFVSGPLHVKNHRILEARNGERFASDHLPIVVDITIKREPGT